ncbi:asparaginase [Nesterenkonia alkaliphila]|uniref:Asparaginase n=1 Tax=Nesterenkonia alkaliphila TaxID=1463631 RepID=A0A7K1UI36_9MICC|nr:asparaginase [Nesterenkonia alkaliphila]MVT26044.1 asparaginase [Nesterenkonia alkaliphila]GFZ86304.1 asparaginase [Nesterenkonia alkaliphila]
MSSVQTAAASESAELAVVTRAGIAESRHVGSAVLVGPEGTVIRSLGLPEAVTFPRSALKPLQAVASLRSGALISPEAVALACGSHVGSPRHQDLAAATLAKERLEESDLKCPEAYPARTKDLQAHLEAGRPKTKLAFNCSGKHAAFLAAARTQGWRLATYTEPEHPLQRTINEVYAEYCGEQPTAVGIDGCGAPAAAMSLTGLARGMGKLAWSLSRRDAEVHAFTVAQAMLDYPWAVRGEGESDTVVMEQLGLLAKSGAEGVLVVAAPDGTTAAVKTLDGSARANHLVALSLLAGAGAIDLDDLQRVLTILVKPITGGAEDLPAGELRLSEQVTQTL